MGFWVFMFIMCLLTPLTMIFVGKKFSKEPPKNINGVFGYRSSMSMKNNDTWQFANNTAGKFWFLSGMAILLVTIVAMLMVTNKSIDLVGKVGGILVGIQIGVLLSSVFYTENKLKKNFDKNGNRI